MTLPDHDAPYVLGQHRKTLAELRAELESARSATVASVLPRWRASVVAVTAAAIVVVGALSLVAAVTATSV